MLAHGGVIGASGVASGGGGGSITVDAATVARWTNNVSQGTASTSASFTPPNNSLLVVFVNIVATGSDMNMSVSGGSLTWTKRVEHSPADSGAYVGYVGVFTATVTTGASMTISCTRSAGTVNTGHTSAKCYILTGHNTSSPIDVVGEGHGSGSPYNPTLLTATAAGRTLYGAFEYAVAGTVSSSDTEDTVNGVNGGDWSALSVYKASDHSAGDVSGNFQESGSPTWNWAAIAVKAA